MALCVHQLMKFGVWRGCKGGNVTAYVLQLSSFPHCVHNSTMCVYINQLPFKGLGHEIEFKYKDKKMNSSSKKCSSDEMSSLPFLIAVLAPINFFRIAKRLFPRRETVKFVGGPRIWFACSISNHRNLFECIGDHFNMH
jgi:hypothetical protein